MTKTTSVQKKTNRTLTTDNFFKFLETERYIYYMCIGKTDTYSIIYNKLKEEYSCTCKNIRTEFSCYHIKCLVELLKSEVNL